MKDDLNLQLSAEPAEDEGSSPQALGRFLLDEQGEWIQEPEATSKEETGPVGEHTARGEHALKSESVQQRILRVKAAENPLLEAAQPLLRALGDMPEQINDITHVEILKNTLKSQITLFGVVCDEVNIPWKKMAIVRYCLCTALDEAAHTTAWGLEAGWSQSNLLNHFEGDNDGGNKFFLLVGRLSMNPTEFADVLEVLLRILGLGFEGRYSIIEDGDRQLSKIRQRLLTLIQSTRNTTPPALSPHGLQPHGPAAREKLAIPVRLSALCAGVLVVSSFLWCKFWLLSRSDGITNDIYAMQNFSVPVVQPAMRLKLAVLLRNEIRQQLLSVDENQKQSKVVLKGDALFLSGSVRVQPEMVKVIERIASEVQRVNGDVLIVGHTDATPISRPGLPNNVALSEKRAAEVAQYFIAAGLPESKVKVRGVGSSQPVANEATAQGRAKNRRVEFFVTY
ncbi:type VI secretion system protein TssL, long form [Citrobacter rodentium]|uniref:T6SS protein Cts1U n=2 Tax=Citrobacter rodentium TaxID=67825 RepID=D2THT1_CITRI|nr:type VI secretion system protein TssL, long form [Citrobacter rodentium]KIQ49545.1 membrane protein [Citrobacter rodentium]QBY29237.1 type VI secretion system protein TssL [Citrobacter rodentium]UHO28909.1 type VI secretion system protein TssL, long form [Citrobacter rodentium NBRC 105723 = DSM 16636]CBG89514.1 T6SS protein Cts1U [Citrobacter rodentium ICC168]HAT8012021.1 type VI secretion system protein TssL [Citrobacter rodentium NBRC 105723 = DSM 16636]